MEAVRMCMGCQCISTPWVWGGKKGFGECDKATGEAELWVSSVRSPRNKVQCLNSALSDNQYSNVIFFFPSDWFFPVSALTPAVTLSSQQGQLVQHRLMSLLRCEKKSLFRFHSLFLYNLPSTTSRIGKNGAASSLTFTQLDCARLSLLWPACSVQMFHVVSCLGCMTFLVRSWKKSKSLRWACASSESITATCCR